MVSTEDDFALDALADALSDAASLHRRSADVADDQALRDQMNERADRLSRLAAELRDEAPEGSGSLVRMIDRAKLSIDRLFDDDDDAALNASREVQSRLVQIIDSHVRNPELTDPTRQILLDVRARVTGGKPINPGQEGLSNLPQ